MIKRIIFLCLLFSSTILLSQSDKKPIDTPLEISLIDNGFEWSPQEDFIITGSHTSAVSLIKHTYYNQRYNKIEVKASVGSVHVSNSGETIVSHIDFETNIANKIEGSDIPTVSARDAIQIMAAEFNLQADASLAIVEQAEGKDQRQTWNDGGISEDPIPAKLVYQKMDNGRYTLAWDLVIQNIENGEFWNLSVDANTGEILDKVTWTISCSFEHNCGDHKDEHAHHNHEGHNHDDHNHVVVAKENKEGSLGKTMMVGTYNVYPFPVESPIYGDRANISDPELLAASPFGWHDTDGVAGAEYTITRGNNCHAYEDDDNPGYSPDGGAALNFDFPIDTNYTTGNQSEDAAITNLFYWTNLCHDVWYMYGFDEASGNFQVNNYGNGGVGNDECNSEAQDGSGTCNANMGTPSDGSSPTMQMYVCSDRDGDLDNGVIVHEYGHGVSNRLTGGPGASGCLGNSEQMGEGWSDYLGLMMTIEVGDAGTDARGIGNWLFGNGPSGPGIRPHPYSTDLSINPHTYDDISSSAVPHGVGSVWCVMLWEMTWALIDEYGFNPDIHAGPTGFGGNNIAMALVTEGMKLQPCSPGFVDGRDAIIAADQAIYGGANTCLIWEAFAKRGLGVSADQGGSGSVSDGTEAFDMPISCIDPTINFNTASMTISENDATTNPPLAGDCRSYTDYDIEVSLSKDASAPVDVVVTATGSASDLMDYEIFNTSFNFPLMGVEIVTLRVFEDGSSETDETIDLQLAITNGGSTDAYLGDDDMITITLKDNDPVPGLPLSTDLASYDMETALAPFTTTNPSGGDTFFQGTSGDATSSFWTVPSNGTGGLVYANDDECNCDMLDVYLYTEIYDLTGWTNSELEFNLFFEERNYQGIDEAAELLVSTDGGSNFTLLSTLAGDLGNWRVETFDISAYDGMSNIQFALYYTDGGGWLYGIAADDFVIKGDFEYAPPIASGLNDTQTLPVYPNDEVYFYNGMDELVAGIQNAAHDFGCITVTTDRDGDGTTALWDSDPTHEVTDKTQLIVAANNDPAAAYDLTLYYTQAEKNGWEATTGLNWNANAKIIKHPTTIADINPTTPEPNGPGTVEQAVTAAGANSFDPNSYYITAAFNTGFSGVAVGDPGVPPSGECNHPDYPALMALYNATNGPGWTNSTDWDVDCDPCNWYGVGCGASNRVRSIDLQNNNLTGTLPPELGDFTFMTSFKVNGNSITGNLPPEVSNLTSLFIMHVNDNLLSGNIIPELGDLPLISDLQLYNNGFTGCYDGNLDQLCSKLGANSTNAKISDGNSMDGDWQDYCECGSAMCPCGVVNVWIGGVGSWDDAASWSLGHVPLACEEVEILDPFDVVNMPASYSSVIYTLYVNEAADLNIPASSKVTVLSDVLFGNWDDCSQH